ncbi:MAG: copper resistance system multicopper oxidase [Alphaproteobacteria bacterium]|nr:copper resistance system multicopper oxidase [Alphaproteobacteria bacterium]
MPHAFRVPTRRQFVLGLAASGGLTALTSSAGKAAPASLTGPDIDLSLGTLPVNITGRRRMATVANGSMPGPLLRLREGDIATIRVSNGLSETSSIHWHGLKLPNAMDGVPGLTFAGIPPGETFTYRFPIVQSGTYWYHSHSGMQEQTGLIGPMILEPRHPEPYAYDRDYVVMLSDWTDEDPMTVMSNLKQQSDYYNYHQRTLGTFIRDVRRDGLGRTLDDRLMWGNMRMSPSDIMDVTGATYTFLVNGLPPAANWTGLFKPGERVRLRFINGAAMTTFDVRIPGLDLTIVQADGSDVEPVTVEEFRIGVAETYDVIVTPSQDMAHAIFAQAQDRSGFALASLAPRLGMAAAAPPLDPAPLRSMADMGMGGMAMGGHDMAGMDHSAHQKPASPSSGGGGDMADMPGMDHSAHAAAAMPQAAALRTGPQVDNVMPSPAGRQDEAGTGLDGNGRGTLRYAQLKARTAAPLPSGNIREIAFHLTGNMERWIWGFDGKKFSEAPPVPVKLGETVRFVLINDTMMEHPIHLHGFLFALENGQGERSPLKHTVNVKPNERVSFVYTADVPGHWAFHCHLMFHMESGMFRTVVVS